MTETEYNSKVEPVLKHIENHGIIPILTIEDAEDAVALAGAISAGGLDLAQINLQTGSAVDAMAKIKGKYPDMVLGAGPVTTVEEVGRAVDAGAEFVVCPGLSQEVAQHCTDNGILLIPACATASEVLQAISYGLTTVQFFPAATMGGNDTIRDLSSAFEQVRFIAAGGIKYDNLNDYSNNLKILACAGDWMADAKLIKSKQFDEITKRVRRSVYKVLNFQFAHFGINCDTAKEGYENIFKLADIFDLTLGDTGSSTYVGQHVEITKKPFKTKGPHGHIGYSSDNVSRAMFHLSKTGVEFDQNSYKYYNDRPFVVYLVDQIAGFAVHIEEKNDHNPGSWNHRDEVRAKIGWAG